MNILLTGGAGYIGSHAAVTLTEAGHKVVLYDNFSNSSELVLEKMHEILGKKLVCVEGDIRDSGLLIKTLRDFKIESVIHFAGLKAVGESVQNPVIYYANNVGGAISLLEAMNFTGVKKLVFSSSATVYGDPHYLPIDECHPANPTSPYGRTKLQIEQILHDLSISDPDWRISCLRYFNPAGSHLSGLIGEQPNGIPNNLMPYICQVAIGKLPFLKLYGVDYPTRDGSGIRDYIHVVDLAEGHLAALNFLNNNLGCHTFNLGTGVGHSVFEMIKVFERESRRIIPTQIHARRSGDVANCFAEVNKAATELNWKARLTLEDMCLSSWNFQKNHTCTNQ